MSVSVIIPTVAGRDDILERVLGAYRATDGVSEVVVEYNNPTCGVAWQKASQAVDGDYVLFGADDLEPLPGWLPPLIEACEAGMVPCPVVLEPDGVTVQSAGATGWDLTKTVPADWGETGWTTVPFIRRDWMDAVLPIPPIHYCTDTWFSAKLQLERGLPTVVRNDSRFVHHNALPGRGAGMDVHARNLHDRARFYELLDEAMA